VAQTVVPVARSRTKTSPVPSGNRPATRSVASLVKATKRPSSLATVAVSPPSKLACAGEAAFPVAAPPATTLMTSTDSSRRDSRGSASTGPRRALRIMRIIAQSLLQTSCSMTPSLMG
jgi:hypothetical protein